MVGYMTAGLLSGLGAGLQNLGKSIEDRREMALKQLHQQLMYERQSADRRAEKQEDREFDRETFQATEAGREARHTASLNQQRELFDAGREEKQEDRSFRAREAEKERQSRAELARLQSRLRSSEDAASTRLKDALDADDVHGITYGEPDAHGLVEVIIVTKSGALRPTGRKTIAKRDILVPVGDGL